MYTFSHTFLCCENWHTTLYYLIEIATKFFKICSDGYICKKYVEMYYCYYLLCEYIYIYIFFIMYL